MENTKETAMKVNWILLGLLMLGAGLIKLFIMKVEGVSGMLSGIALFSWAPMFWAWILILSEIIFGILILAKWKLQYTVIPPMIIMIVAAFTMNWPFAAGSLPKLSGFLLHLVAASSYWVLGSRKR